MQVTQQERLMYQVMKAICDSGIPIDFKGAMVLKACLDENGFTGDTRHTMDIDANWISDEPPTAEQMLASLSKALEQDSINLDVRLNRMYGTGRSAGFVFCQKGTGDAVFSMDMDVNRPIAGSKMYTVEDFRFRGVIVWQILADKISAVSTDKVFRRIKDVVDLYYLSQCVPMDAKSVRGAMAKTGRNPESFEGFLLHRAELLHAYDKFRFGGGAEKPVFDTVYDAVKLYIKDFLPQDAIYACGVRPTK